MPKNIVLCCDGTANEFAADRTNVVKLYYTLVQDPARQVTFYHPGLGTMEPAGALTTAARSVTKVLGLALGYGLANDIRDAYAFLMETYEEGDQVFLFGFSRGAYTARAVCSLLHIYGLIHRGNESLVPYAIRMMLAIEKAGREKPASNRAADDPVQRYFSLAADFKKMMCRCECKPHFVGVWDTVSSVGWKDHPLKLPFVSDNPDIAIGRHAVSIDERRAFFRNHLWIPSKAMTDHGPKDVLQVWFPGVHCDVGGGYPEAESGLAKIALEWMLEQAKMAGLCVRPERQQEVLGQIPNSGYMPPDYNAGAHESLQKWWKIAEFIDKPHYNPHTGETEMRANHGRRRTILEGSMIHESAFLRQGGKYAQEIGLDPAHFHVVKTQYAPAGPCGKAGVAG